MYIILVLAGGGRQRCKVELVRKQDLVHQVKDSTTLAPHVRLHSGKQIEPQIVSVTHLDRDNRILVPYDRHMRRLIRPSAMNHTNIKITREQQNAENSNDPTLITSENGQVTNNRRSRVEDIGHTMIATTG